VNKIKEVVYLLESAFKWIENISSSALEVCDGMGSYKVFNKMTDCKITLEKFGEVELCNYINLNESDKLQALNMRNHIRIKKWMHNQGSISEEDHFGFIENLEIDTVRRYFLIKQKDNIIGSINFSKINFENSLELGIYTNPFFQIKDAGRLLESAASQYAFIEIGVKKIKLEVYSDNERAVNFYKKCDFNLINTKKANHQNIMYMEKIKVLEGVSE
jgi:UDP-4-amino-4,6-dideoxy-N-acetyl-beta-L-altrosamine N-acetyltransferase